MVLLSTLVHTTVLRNTSYLPLFHLYVVWIHLIVCGQIDGCVHVCMEANGFSTSLTSEAGSLSQAQSSPNLLCASLKMLGVRVM